MNHLDKAKSALEYANGFPVRDAKDMALLAIANALVAMAERGAEIERTEDKPNSSADNGAERSNDGVTRWAQLFGTPERAAATVAGMPCGARPCSECPVFEPCDGYKLDGGVVLAEWLRGDAE